MADDGGFAPRAVTRDSSRTGRGRRGLDDLEAPLRRLQRAQHETELGAPGARIALHDSGRADRTSDDFYQLLRRLEAGSPSAPRIGHSSRPSLEPVRFGQAASLAFPAGALARVAHDALAGRLRVLVNCFGLLGPNGPMPLHLTEYARQREKHHGDSTLVRFLDLFHHRLLSFFYRAWADAQPAVQRDRAESDRFVTYLGALVGIGMPSLRGRDALPDEARLYYAGHFAAHSRNAEGLRALLADYFGLPVAIEEFVGEWVEIPPEHRWRLGDGPAPAASRHGGGPAAAGSMLGKLGQSTYLGARIWMCQSRFRVVFGPLTRAQFNRVSPGGAALPAVVALIRSYAGDELHWDLRLHLRPDAVPAFVLGEATLGQTSWLGARAAQATRDDLVFDPQARA